MFTESQLKVVRFCAEECKRQKSGEISVANMVDAWNCATIEIGGELGWTTKLVLELGFHVEPEKNRNGFRRIGVIFSAEDGAIPWTTIPDNINRLMESIDLSDPHMADEFYQYFEKIHPFIDGNGRVGAILYNMILGNMDNPITPPEFRR